MNYALYNPDGSIDSIFHTSLPAMVNLQPLPSVECGPDVLDTTHYVSGGQVVAKTPFAYTLTTSGLVVAIEGLPAGVTVEVEGQTLVTDDLPTEIEFDLAGAYTVELFGSVPHLDETLEVTVG